MDKKNICGDICVILSKAKLENTEERKWRAKIIRVRGEMTCGFRETLQNQDLICKNCLTHHGGEEKTMRSISDSRPFLPVISGDERGINLLRGPEVMLTSEVPRNWESPSVLSITMIFLIFFICSVLVSDDVIKGVAGRYNPSQVAANNAINASKKQNDYENNRLQWWYVQVN